MQKKSLVLGLIFFLCLASSAFAGPGKLVGAWEVQVDGPDAPLFLYTFQKGGTAQGGSTDLTSGGYGVWEKVAPRTFEAKIVGYLIGPDGQATARTIAVLLLEILPGGDTAEVAYDITIETFDGVELANFPATGTAHRIELW